MKKNKLQKLLFFFSFITLICYLSVFISPYYFWPIGLLNYLIPVLIVVQLFLLILALVRNKKLLWIPLITIILGYYFIDITFNIPLQRSEKSSFEVLSFNARYFRERRDYSKYYLPTIDWAVNEDADIKCFQEFSARPGNKKTEVVERMKKQGYHAYAVEFDKEDYVHSRGVAIFSKFPIINKGFIKLNENSINNCMFVDVVIKNDTVRIYNFHLKSMGLDLGQLKKPKQFSDATKSTATKLGSASSKRALELSIILEHVGNCPYPYVLTCDFNELIYGNNYYKVRQHALDTFEAAGNGFGFTFNSFFLFFIRLDHQFFGGQIEAVNFKVIKEIKSSDHFPVKGYYNLIDR